MKYKNFLLRAVNLLLIWGYCGNTSRWRWSGLRR